jgi:hypothetical protein
MPEVVIAVGAATAAVAANRHVLEMIFGDGGLPGGDNRPDAQR